jgi:hypothetical protein
VRKGVGRLRLLPHAHPHAHRRHDSMQASRCKSLAGEVGTAAAMHVWVAIRSVTASSCARMAGWQLLELGLILGGVGGQILGGAGGARDQDDKEVAGGALWGHGKKKGVATATARGCQRRCR